MMTFKSRFWEEGAKQKIVITNLGFGRVGFHLFICLLGRIPWGYTHEEKKSTGLLVVSCLTCLLAFCDEMTGLMDEGKVLGVFYLNFLLKAFYTVIMSSDKVKHRLGSVMDLKLIEMPYVRGLSLVVYHRGSLLGWVVLAKSLVT